MESQSDACEDSQMESIQPNLIISNEDFPSLWQAEFLIYLIIFKSIITFSYILSNISYSALLYLVIVLSDILGFLAIRNFSIYLNRLYFLALCSNALLLMLIIFICNSSELELTPNTKLQIVFSLGLAVYEFYRISAHVRFHQFLLSLNSHKRTVLIEYMKENYSGIV